MNDWLQALQKVREEKVEKPDPGFKTVKELAAGLGLSRRRTRDLVTELVEEGRAERKTFKTIAGAVYHYKLLK